MNDPLQMWERCALRIGWRGERCASGGIIAATLHGGVRNSWG